MIETELTVKKIPSFLDIPCVKDDKSIPDEKKTRVRWIDQDGKKHERYLVSTGKNFEMKTLHDIFDGSDANLLPKRTGKGGARRNAGQKALDASGARKTRGVSLNPAEVSGISEYGDGSLSKGVQKAWQFVETFRKLVPK